ncbi:SRPBCC family protein [Rhizobium sp. TH2]|uniref:SRPBCC family protein n=1 Tax=Rhizobium sp. TH2 TaxID=2775403 RepID=UPI002158306C|nr:SRPBCC family protein [Rhizobium sp. TH2]UVC07399.1 SRPBCC family protein [Rhizobium sp. TH2]
MTITAHDTIVFERCFVAPLPMLYKAFMDPVARCRWGAPSPTAVIIYDQEDFRVGGRDLSRCGSKDDPRFHVEATYLDIVPESRIVYSEAVTEGGKRLSAALHTIEMKSTDGQSSLRITVQIAAFDGAAMADGVRHGFRAALDNLTRELAG